MSETRRYISTSKRLDLVIKGCVTNMKVVKVLIACLMLCAVDNTSADDGKFVLSLHLKVIKHFFFMMTHTMRLKKEYQYFTCK